MDVEQPLIEGLEPLADADLWRPSGRCAESPRVRDVVVLIAGRPIGGADNGTFAMHLGDQLEKLLQAYGLARQH